MKINFARLGDYSLCLVAIILLAGGVARILDVEAPLPYASKYHR